MATPVTFTAPQGLQMSILSAKNGSTMDLYMRIQVPLKYGWGAIGIGEGMDDAMVFVTYPSSNGKESTLSVRHASGQFEPEPLNSNPCETQIAETTDSSINTAFVCYGLGDYPKLQNNPRNSAWIFSVGAEEKVESNSDDAHLHYHGMDHRGFFNLDMIQAQTPNTGNLIAPVINNGSSIGSEIEDIQASPSEMLIKAHAALLGLAFLVFLPLGLILLRFRSTRFHWITQTFGFVLALCGWIIAIVMCTDSTEFADFTEPHQIIGLIAVALLFPQLLLGTIHHARFRSTGLTTWMRLPHIFTGRVAMTLGLINGIIGFNLYGDNNGAIIYGVFAAVVFVSVTGLMIWDYIRTKNSRKPNGRPLADSEKVPH